MTWSNILTLQLAMLNPKCCQGSPTLTDDPNMKCLPVFGTCESIHCPLPFGNGDLGKGGYLCSKRLDPRKTADPKRLLHADEVDEEQLEHVGTNPGRQLHTDSVKLPTSSPPLRSGWAMRVGQYKWRRHTQQAFGWSLGYYATWGASCLIHHTVTPLLSSHPLSACLILSAYCFQGRHLQSSQQRNSKL